LELVLILVSQNWRNRTLLSDIPGGSIRVPSAFNFLYGIRPSHGRLPCGKMANSMEGQETVHSVCGPITHSVKGSYEIL
jgi:Asp-tRNA(Asn)/Glu-tRNA(Gln) amidotransferase A subunit family amidase